MDDLPFPLLMVDPSLLLSQEGLAWLEGEESVHSGIVIPTVFGEWLREERDLDIESLVSPEDIGAIWERRSMLVEILGEDFTTFSYRQSDLPVETRTVLERLLESGDSLSELHADEWAFLQSYSTLGSKLRHPVRAFRDAGAAVLEFGREVGLELLAEVIPPEHIPAVLTGGVIAKGVIKWIVVGGATIGGGTLGGLLGTLGGQVGGEAANAISKAAVLAIDP
jgi:hypothetical protein